jgi:hypothetical protein
MRVNGRLPLTAILVVASVVSVAACSDSTAPKQLSAAQLAAHFDSLSIAATAKADTVSAYGVRGFLTTLIELPAALGAVPANVTVTTASGSESWKAYELLEVTAPTAGTPDSAYILLMFRDGDAHTALVADFDSSGVMQDAGVITGDTIVVNPSDGSGSSSLTSISSACTTPSAGLLNPALGTFTSSSCNLAKFKTSLEVTLPATTGLDAALTSVSFSNVTVNGVHLVDQEEGASVRRVKAILRAAAASRRH